MFFSSRRRHTRYWRDWSSDVCSSDLIRIDARDLHREIVHDAAIDAGASADASGREEPGERARRVHRVLHVQIGRASCKGKSVDLGGRRIIKKKTIHARLLFNTLAIFF